MTTTLPEKFRLARNLEKGYEIQANDDTWHLITDVWDFAAPIPMVVLFLEGIGRINPLPRNETVMSRRRGDS